MQRLVFIVEGHSEIKLVDNLIIPYLHEQGINITAHSQTITTNRKQHKKGGVPSYGLFRNELKRTLAQGNVLVTTFIDYYKLPTDFPAYTNDSRHILKIEQAISKDFDESPHLIPYIQRHELEALMFSSMSGFDLVIDDEKALLEIEQVHSSFKNPEDINDKPEKAPSKRLESLFNYQKVSDAELIFEMMNMNDILHRCPRFAEWITKLQDRLA